MLANFQIENKRLKGSKIKAQSIGMNYAEIHFNLSFLVQILVTNDGGGGGRRVDRKNPFIGNLVDG